MIVTDYSTLRIANEFMLLGSHYLKLEGSDVIKTLMNIYTTCEHPQQVVDLTKRATELGFIYENKLELTTPVCFSILYSGLSPIKSIVPLTLGLYHLPFNEYIRAIEIAAKHIVHK